MRLPRFTVPDGQVAFNASSEYVLISRLDRHNWHSGGQMVFAPDRFLHIVIGDEGVANDSHGTARKINNRLFAGICEGPDGEPSFMELGNTGTDTGKIYRLVRNGTPVPDPHATLSQTGAFTSLARRRR